MVTFVGVVVDVVGSQLQCRPTVNVMQRVPRHCDVSSSDHVTTDRQTQQPAQQCVLAAKM